MKKLLGILVLGLLVSTPAYSETSEKRPQFPYTADAQLEISNFDEELKKIASYEIRNEKYWNEPLTRLDYVLMQLKIMANEYQEFMLEKDGLFSKWIQQDFEKAESVFAYYKKDFKVDNSVYFNEESGKIVVSFEIGDLGKSKRPLSEICKSFLGSHIAGHYFLNQELLGYTYHNKILKELYRGDDYSNYNEYLNKIAKNLAYLLVLKTQVIADREKKIVDHFLLSCGKLTNEDKYIFNKHSFSISPNN